MYLRIKPASFNRYPLRGFLIEGTSLSDWIKELQLLNCQLDQIQIYPIPSDVANVLWGCLILPAHPLKTKYSGKHQLCQEVYPGFFIPEKSELDPKPSQSDLEAIVSSCKRILHPAFGHVELTQELELEGSLKTPKLDSFFITTPEKGIAIPMEIQSFEIQALAPEESIKALEKKLVPKHEKLPDEALTVGEKIKLSFYKLLFKRSKKPSSDAPKPQTQLNPESQGNGSFLSKFMRSFGNLLAPISALSDRMQNNYEDLEKRNQRAVDKLLDLLKTNPDEALKYAIPLDEQGTGRGPSNGSLSLSKRWSSFSFFGNNQHSGSGGSTTIQQDEYQRLQQQYQQIARDLIEKKDYQKAAFVYFKLLKNYHLSASTLEEGKLYQEAASIYLKHVNNKQKAAECYEKGNMLNEAIELYKEMKEFEKVGDLYLKTKQRKLANTYYEQEIQRYKDKNQFIKGALIYKEKMNQSYLAQDMLLEGWRSHTDSQNCLSMYFSNIPDSKEQLEQFRQLAKTDLINRNKTIFLTVLKNNFLKGGENSDSYKELAYQIAADFIQQDPSVAKELAPFDATNKGLIKDAIRFQIKGKK